MLRGCNLCQRQWRLSSAHASYASAAWRERAIAYRELHAAFSPSPFFSGGSQWPICIKLAHGWLRHHKAIRRLFSGIKSAWHLSKSRPRLLHIIFGTFVRSTAEAALIPCLNKTIFLSASTRGTWRSAQNVHLTLLALCLPRQAHVCREGALGLRAACWQERLSMRAGRHS